MGDKGGRKDKEKARKQTATKQKAIKKGKIVKQTKGAEVLDLLGSRRAPSK